MLIRMCYTAVVKIEHVGVSQMMWIIFGTQIFRFDSNLIPHRTFGVRSIRHVEQSFRITNKFVDVSFTLKKYVGKLQVTIKFIVIYTSNFLHYSFFVIIPKRSAQFIVVHGWSIFLSSPSSGNLKGKLHFFVIKSSFL